VSLRIHEIAEADHRILNPFTEDKLMLLGEVCRLTSSMRQLDLACGKGEMLCRWSERWGTSGVGVDISHVFLDAALQRAAELGVADRVTFIHGDAGMYSADADGFNVVSCIGATWIGGGLVGTLRLMLRASRGDGLLIVGEPYWIDPPPAEAYAAWGVGEDDFTSLIGTLDRFQSLDLELVEMVLADGDSWDRYEGAQWRTLDRWLRDHADDPDHAAVRAFLTDNRRAYLAYGRRYFGWGVFVLRGR
jgi:SAM-dependent methyltransferase